MYAHTHSLIPGAPHPAFHCLQCGGNLDRGLGIRLVDMNSVAMQTLVSSTLIMKALCGTYTLHLRFHISILPSLTQPKRVESNGDQHTSKILFCKKTKALWNGTTLYVVQIWVMLHAWSAWKLWSGVLCSWCHSFTVQSALQLRKMSPINGDHRTR